MAHISISTAVVGLVIAMSGAATAAEPLIRASIVDGHVYISPLSNALGTHINWIEPGGHFTLMGRGLAPGDPPVTLRHPAVVESRPLGYIAHRWQIDRKRVHFLTYDTSENSGLHPYTRNKTLTSYPLEFVKKLTAPVATTRKDHALLQEMERTSTGDYGGPLVGNRQFGPVPADWNYEHFDFDFLPTADGRYEWYGSEHDGQQQSRLTRWESLSPAKKGERTKWKEVDVWPGVFGPFFVTAAGVERNIVTEKGRVFAAPRGAKPRTPLKDIWKGPPVEVLIHDADNAKWYGFTKDEYFEIADPIKPKPHTLVIRRDQSVKEPYTTRAWGADEALDRAVKCGRVIRGLPEPKKE